MPSYRVDLPDGTSYRVDSPNDLEESQVIDQVRRQQAAQPTSSEQPVKAPAPAPVEAGGETPPSTDQPANIALSRGANEPPPSLFEPLQDYASRTWGRVKEAGAAAANIPHSAAELIAPMGPNEGRVHGALGLLGGTAGAVYSALLSPVGAAFETASRKGLGTSEETAKTVGDVGEIAATLGTGMLAAVNRLGPAGMKVADILGVKPLDPSTVVANSLKSIMDQGVTQRDMGQGIIRSTEGQITRERAQQIYDLTTEIKRWAGKSKDENLAAKVAVQSGDISKLPAEDQALVKMLGDGFEARKQKVIQLGEKEGTDFFDSFVKYYWPQQWQDTNKAAETLDRMITQRTAAEGSKDFLHSRNVDSIEEGLKQGLVEKYPNLIDSALAKNAEMDRFIAAHNIKNGYLESGLAFGDQTAGERAIGKTLERITGEPPGTATIPPGWVKLDDRLFSGRRYFAPPEVAKDFNSHFAPGLKGNPYYDAVLGLNQNMTAAQLSFSGFHWVTEAANAYMSDLSLAIEKGGRLDPGTIAPALRAASIVGSPVRAITEGSKFLMEYLKPGSYSQYAEEAKLAAESGADFRLDPALLNKSISAFRTAVRDGDWAKAVAQSIPALLQAQARPLMRYYVPKIKAGVAQLMWRDVLDRSAAEGWSPARLRLEAQKVWDSTGNRLGQLQLEHFFWPKAVTDIAESGIRAPRWMLGDFAEYGGGALDLKTQTGRAIAEGKFEITHRMAFSMATVIGTAYLNGIATWIATGEFPSGKDYIWPRDGTKDANGNWNRINPVGYARDIIAYSTHPFKAFYNRTAPWITGAVDLIQNRDFYNTEIRHPSDPLVNQGADIVKHIAELSGPFSVKTYLQRAESQGGGSPGLIMQSIAGLLPAPREFIKTPAENLATELSARHYAAGPSTKDERQKLDQRLTLENGFRRGVIGVGDLIKAVGKGTINQTQLNNIIRNKGLPTIVNSIRPLNADEAFQVYNKANLNERQFIYHEVSRKLVNAMKANPEDSSLRDRLIEFSSIPLTPPQSK